MCVVSLEHLPGDMASVCVCVMTYVCCVDVVVRARVRVVLRCVRACALEVSKCVWGILFVFVRPRDVESVTLGSHVWLLGCRLMQLQMADAMRVIRTLMLDGGRATDGWVGLRLRRVTASDETPYLKLGLTLWLSPRLGVRTGATECAK